MSKLIIPLLALIGLVTFSNSMFLVHRVLNGIPDAHSIFCRYTPDGDEYVHELQCANEATIFIVSAMVGQIDLHRCYQNDHEYNSQHVRYDCDEVVTTTAVVQELCSGRNKCRIKTDHFPDSCEYEWNQYVNVTYNCLTKRPAYRPFTNELYGRNSILFN